MSIDYRDNTMYLRCDECSRPKETYFGDWKEAWTEAKGDGWRGWKDNTGTWCHSCPSCVKTDIPGARAEWEARS